MNNITITGNVVADPERIDRSGFSYCKVRVAVDRDEKRKEGKQSSDFFNVHVFDQAADFVSRFVSRGSRAEVVGKMRIDQYKDREGNSRDYAYVRAYRFDSPKSRDNDGGRSGGNTSGSNWNQGGSAGGSWGSNQNDPIPF